MKRKNGRIVGQLTSQDWGTTLSFRSDGGVQTAKVKATNPRTLGQSYQRLKMPNVAEFYKAAKVALKDAFQDAAASLYAELVRYNITKEDLPVGITKQMKEAGGCIVMPYLISKGTLAPITVDGNYHTDVLVSGLPVINGQTTIGALAKAIVEGNGDRFHYGDRISFFEFVQVMRAGVPGVVVNYAAVTLIENSTVKLETLASLKGFNVLQGHLAMSGQPALGGFCWVHSRRIEETGELLLSQQSVITKNDDIIEMFTTPDALREAAESYGSKLEAAAVLDPSNLKQRRIAAKFGIDIDETASAVATSGNTVYSMFLEYDGVRYREGQDGPEIDLSASKKINVKISDAGLIDPDELELAVNGKPCTGVAISNDNIEATMPDSLDGENIRAIFFTDGAKSGSMKFA